MQKIKMAESPLEGHPDKLADQIADEILDDFMRKDPFSRVSLNVLITGSLVFVAGEVSSNAYVDIPFLSRKVIKEVGYTKAEYGFDGDLVQVINSISEQSPEIALSIAGEGAGDSAIVIGYATNETQTLMPFPISMAHLLSKKLSSYRKSGHMPFLRPDGKVILSVVYEDEKPLFIENLSIFVQHDPEISLNHLREMIVEDIIKKTIDEKLFNKDSKIMINPAGRFVIGGPASDTGLTGRKIISDAYGESSFSGGSAFSGKDPTKTDRTGSIMARVIAKNLVMANLCDRALVQIGYAFGVKDPISFFIDCFGTEKVSIDKIRSSVLKTFELSSKKMIEFLGLRKPIYRKSACYGHFGREELYWENLNFVDKLLFNI